MTRKQALGRGLKALIPDTPHARSGLAEIPLARIRPNPNQPRHRFDPAALDELAASIAEHGVLQPLLVAEDGGGGYVLVAGERRLRAAERAGLAVVPAVIRERLDDQGELALALVENLQRSDLTPLEAAHAFSHLRDVFGLSQEDIAKRVGIDRSTVSNALRLLKLEPEIQAMVDDGRIAAGHARALLAITEGADRLGWAQRAAAGAASVRDLERAGTAKRSKKAGAGARRQRRSVDPNLRAAEERLSLRLGARVEIRQRRRGSTILIDCRDQAELIRVFDRLMGEESDAAES
ncbi:MAG: ParB/RepB/Spo0J family partition protein [Acidobacteria bacterium]|jgi:ParB family transcriptional regulator, chromosome partitioning protein|nr:ParB/RepB/Spo0J family partition protein [Acidobacteriota bacterium]